jgi:hypothetical protein
VGDLRGDGHKTMTEHDAAALARVIQSDDDDASYCAYYCEENSIRLALRLRDIAQFGDIRVVFVSNAQKAVPLWRMRCGNVKRDLFVAFDYHVFVVARKDADHQWIVVDMDAVVQQDDDKRNATHTRLFDFDAYYRLVMRGLTSVERMFRVVPLEAIEREFQSDRSHMRNSQTDDWLAPPPTWDVLFGAKSTNLFARFVDSARDEGDERFGRVMSEMEFIEVFGVPNT